MDIGIDEIATRTKDSTQTDEQNRSQTGSRNRTTSSRHDNKSADEEEVSIASRNMRRRNRNKTRRKLLTDRQQDNQMHWQGTVILPSQQITNDRRLPTYQSQIIPSEENNSYEY